MIRRAAVALRTDPTAADHAGLPHPGDARALAALLEIVAAALPHVDAGVRTEVVAGCRELLACR